MRGQRIWRTGGLRMYKSSLSMVALWLTARRRLWSSNAGVHAALESSQRRGPGRVEGSIGSMPLVSCQNQDQVFAKAWLTGQLVEPIPLAQQAAQGVAACAYQLPAKKTPLQLRCKNWKT